MSVVDDTLIFPRIRGNGTMTIVLTHSNGAKSEYRNVVRVDCDGVVVAIHFYDSNRDIESAYYDLGYDPKHSECTVTGYEVNI